MKTHQYVILYIVMLICIAAILLFADWVPFLKVLAILVLAYFTWMVWELDHAMEMPDDYDDDYPHLTS